MQQVEELQGHGPAQKKTHQTEPGVQRREGHKSGNGGAAAQQSVETARVEQDVQEILKSLGSTAEEEEEEEEGNNNDDDAAKPIEDPPKVPRKMKAVRCLCGTTLNIRAGETQRCSSCGKKVSAAEMEAWRRLMDVYEHDAARGIVPDISSFLPVRSSIFNDFAFSAESPKSASPPLSPDLLPTATEAMLLPAARDGDAVIVAAALRNSNVDPNVVGEHGSTCILLAALYAETAVVKVLLADKRVNLNHANDYGYTALIWSSQQGHEEVVALLLAEPRRRLDRNVADREGWTALCYAAQDNHTAVVALLLADTAVDPDAVGPEGVVPLVLAAFYERREVLEMLLADHRTTRTRPDHNGQHYDSALRNVKRRRNASFKGLVRAFLVFRRLRASLLAEQAQAQRAWELYPGPSQ